MQLTVVHRLFFVLFFAAFPAELWAQFTSTINCLFPRNWEGRQAMVVLKPIDQKAVIDTATIVNRTVSFTVSADEPSPAYLWVEGNQEDIYFFVDSPQINLQIDASSPTQALITGSYASESWARHLSIINNAREAGSDLQTEMMTAYLKGDTLLAALLEQQADSAQNVSYQVVTRIILEQPLLPSSWYLFASNSFSYGKTLELFSVLSSFSQYPSYQKIAERLQRMQLGKKAPDFTIPTLKGNGFSLSKLSGNYVLIDFSNRLLVPCRKRQNDLKLLYRKYHTLGLEIVTVAFEFDKKAGLEALQKTPLPWIQGIELIDSSSIMEQYEIERMPDNVLLDATKTMIARDLSVRELDAMLSELLKR